MNEETNKTDSIAINEVQLILAEKRTSLSLMRTGIAVLALPLSVMSFLIATSKYYNVLNVLHIFLPLGVLNFSLIFLGGYLVIRSIIRIKHYDLFIKKIKKTHSRIGEFVE